MQYACNNHSKYRRDYIYQKYTPRIQLPGRRSLIKDTVNDPSKTWLEIEYCQRIENKYLRQKLANDFLDKEMKDKCVLVSPKESGFSIFSRQHHVALY